MAKWSIDLDIEDGEVERVLNAIANPEHGYHKQYPDPDFVGDKKDRPMLRNPMGRHEFTMDWLLRQLWLEVETHEVRAATNQIRDEIRAKLSRKNEETEA